MFEREMTETLTRRSRSHRRSPQHPVVACKPTFRARHAPITLTRRARSRRLAPPHDTRRTLGTPERGYTANSAWRGDLPLWATAWPLDHTAGERAKAR